MSVSRNPDYADTLLREAIAASASGLDLVTASDALCDFAEALKQQAAALKKAKYDPKKFEAIARACAHTMKALDMLMRLAEFAKGKPDSRPHLAGDWLTGLTEEQLGQVQRWVEENAERVEAEKEINNVESR